MRKISIRKNICFITARPEKSHGKRMLDGIFTQCRKYGYNVTVVSSLTHLQNFAKTFSTGEQNIYNLIDYSCFDAVILDTIALTEDYSGAVMRKISNRIQKDCHVPVVALIVPYRNFHCIGNCNEPILREMCRHVIEVHNKKDICILTGHKGHSEAESRLAVFLDEIQKHGLSVSDEHIIYGDFWYDSGIKLGEDLLDGTVSMPEAVICASDHMALGLIEKLTLGGVKIPEDLIVIGYEGTDEAALSKITLTTYESNEKQSAADAVDYIRKQLEPDAEIDPFINDINNNLHCGMSCGCEPDTERSTNKFHDALYITIRNYSSADFTENVDIGQLMESYVFEKLTSSGTPKRCIDNIYENTNLIEPFTNFYLCLLDNWLDIDSELITGYPEKMRLVLASSNNGEMSFHDDSQSFLFDTSKMIPRMHEDCDVPYVFYFSAIHFNEKTLGYAVLQRELDCERYVNLVYRNWLRFVNNSLEMVRTKYKYMISAVTDQMTGLLNRRGMYEKLDILMNASKSADRLFVAVVDMDKLKYVNDTYGHSEGDYCITAVASAAQKVTMTDELCVRAGGDEFFIIGVGDYDESDINKRIKKFTSTMQNLSDSSGKEYVITASIGCAVGSKDSFDETLSAADKEMYINKQKRKKENK